MPFLHYIITSEPTSSRRDRKTPPTPHERLRADAGPPDPCRRLRGDRARVRAVRCVAVPHPFHAVARPALRARLRTRRRCCVPFRTGELGRGEPARDRTARRRDRGRLARALVRERGAESRRVLDHLGFTFVLLTGPEEAAQAVAF